MTAKYQPALACFSAQNQYHILHYLTVLAARQYTGATLNAIVAALLALRRQVPGKRASVLTQDLTQTTAQDISAFISAAQASGLAPSTMNTKVGLLAGFFDYLREEGLYRVTVDMRQHCTDGQRSLLQMEGA